jgi:membrane protease YdiL (CAAX protease family)
MYLVIFLCVYAFARTDKISLRKLGFRRVANWKSLMLAGGLVGFVAQLTIFLLVAAVSTIYFFEYFGFPITTPLHIFIPLLLIGGPAAAVVEEAAFRGYIQKTLTARLGFIRALMITSVLFAVTHIIFYVIYLAAVQGMLETALKLYLITTLLSLFPLGVFLGYAYQKTGQNLICSISIHTINNVFGLFLIFYSTYALSIATIEYSTLILISLIRAGVTAAVLWALLYKICERF